MSRHIRFLIGALLVACTLGACGDDLTTAGFDLAAPQDFAGSPVPDLGSTDGAPGG